MLKNDFLDRVKAIGALEDIVEIREQLIQLSDETVADYDTFDALQSKHSTLQSENEKLRQANMKMFLRFGEKTEEKLVVEKEQPKLTYESLFNEKGEFI